METKQNPNARKWKLPDGYIDLGWQLHRGNNEQVKQCFEKGHHDKRTEPHTREFDNSLYLYRCTDVITICDECKIVWHVDMSD